MSHRALGRQFTPRIERRIRAADKGAEKAVEASHIEPKHLVHKAITAVDKVNTVMDIAQSAGLLR
jgi:hypothetical protein